MKKVITIIVIVLIMFFSVEWISRFRLQKEPSRWDLSFVIMNNIESAINAYYLNTGQYPKTFNDLITCPAGLESVWAGPYLKQKQLKDPWGNEYKYELGYRLLSYGADGKPGGKGENRDISLLNFADWRIAKAEQRTKDIKEFVIKTIIPSGILFSILFLSIYEYKKHRERLQ
jgi:general secretion pathway protein G